MNFLPGEPNSSPQATSFVKWNHRSVFAYCSGNNLILLTNLLNHLQTIGFPEDAQCVDINPSNGSVAVSCRDICYLYRPKINKYGEVHWNYSNEFAVPRGSINSIGWGNELELIIGTSDQLILLHIQEKNSNCGFRLIWTQLLVNPVYLVKFSQNSELIACISRYDKFVKFFYRTNFDINNTQFNMLYLKHSSFITDLKFRFIDQTRNSDAKSSNYTILYTISDDNYIRVFLSFEFQKSKKIQHWGSLKLSDSSINANNNDELKNRKFIKLIDNFFFDYLISRSSERFIKHNKLTPALKGHLDKLVKLESDLIMVSDYQGNLSFYLVCNLNSNPPKSILFKKLLFNNNTEINSSNSSIKSNFLSNINQTITFPDGIFPRNPRFLDFSDSIKIYKKNHSNNTTKNITFANYHQHKSSDGEFSNMGDISFIIHDLVKKSLRYVYLRLDGFLENINFDELYRNYDELFIGNLNASITNITLKEKPSIISFSEKSVNIKNHDDNKQFHQLNAILANKLTGHNKSIQKLFKDLSGLATLSVSRFNEHKLWKPVKLTNQKIILQKFCTLNSNDVNGAILLRSGDIISTYSNENEIFLWNTKNLKVAEKITNLKININNCELMAFFHAPQHYNDYEHDKHYLIAVYKSQNDYSTLVTKAWKFSFKSFKIEEVLIDDLHFKSPINTISPVDPVGWKVSLDRYARDVLTTITKDGVLQSFSIKISNDQISWIENCEIVTKIENCSFIKGSSIHKIAISNSERNKLFVFNTKYSLLEYTYSFNAQDEIEDLDWANMMTESNRNVPCILSVGFKHSVLLFCQLNFDYTNDLPSFAPIKEIVMKKYSDHKINDSMWLSPGLLIMAIGNQLFINDNFTSGSLTKKIIDQDIFTKKIIGDRSLKGNCINSIFELVEVLNNTLPVFHPQLIIQCIYLEKLDLVKKILLNLYLYLKSIDLSDYDENGYEEEDDDKSSIETSILTNDVHNKKKFKIKNLPRMLGISIEEFYLQDSKVTINEYFNKNDIELYTIENFLTWISKLKDLMQQISLPVLTRHQQMTLITVIESIEIIEKYKLITIKKNKSDKKLDLMGINFLLGYKLYQSHFRVQKSLNMRDNLFGMHSNNKDVLLDIINGNTSIEGESNNNNKLSWDRFKRTGMCYWLTDSMMIEQFENIGNNEFQNSVNDNFRFKKPINEIQPTYFEDSKGVRNPINSTIFFLALHKKNILIKLWKICHGHNEQQKLVKFLSLDFENSAKHKLSAVKNAFALLSKHRYYMAACFFLLGGKLEDCIDVLIKQCDDIELAISVARVYESTEYLKKNKLKFYESEELLNKKENFKGPIFQKILFEHLLPLSIISNDKWLSSYVYHNLEEPLLLTITIISSPIETINSFKTFLTNKNFENYFDKVLKIIETKKKKSNNSSNSNDNDYLKMDPILSRIFLIYRSSTFPDKEVLNELYLKEFQFIYRVSMIFSRMGCDYLSLELLNNWKFISEKMLEKFDDEKIKDELIITPQPNIIVNNETKTIKKSFNFEAIEEEEKTNVNNVAVAEFDMGAFGF